ncbi:MAG: hypothetical protein KJ906_04440, partial [Nanoarchaeota archaeon]|nr:hypothetical protein [Nanoarchaeota archaeon]
MSPYTVVTKDEENRRMKYTEYRTQGFNKERLEFIAKEEREIVIKTTSSIDEVVHLLDSKFVDALSETMKYVQLEFKNSLAFSDISYISTSNTERFQNDIIDDTLLFATKLIHLLDFNNIWNNTK